MARLCDVIGQNAAVSGLLSALRGERVGGAYLFAGPPKTGRTTTALALGSALQCETPDAFDACGSCTSCRRVMAGHHPDVLLVEPETHSMKIEQVREVKRWAALSSFHGGQRVVIFRNAERLTTDAANSLLKLLEESDADCVFILVAHHPDRLLPTLVSRCRLIPFRRVARGELERELQARGVERERAEALTALADGRPGRVLGDAPTNISAERDAVIKWANGLESTSPGRRLWEMDAWGKDRGAVEERIRLLQSWIRDLVVWQSTGEVEFLTHFDRLDEVRAQAERHEVSALVDALEQLGVALWMLRSQGSVRLVLDHVAIRCDRAVRAG